MAAQSTLRFTVLGDRPCFETVHPWMRSCTAFYLHALHRTVANTASVFVPLYCLPVVIRIFTTGIHRSEFRDALISSFRTTMYLSLHVSLSLGLSCVFRTLMGRYTQYTTALIPSIVGGVGFLAEDRKQWNVAMVMFGNTLLERLLLVGERKTGIPPTPALLTCLFMASSGGLLYLLRRPDFRHLLQSGDTPWFFYPPSLKEGCNSRVDDDPKNVLKEFTVTARLLAAGIALQVLRVVAKNVHRPAAIAGHLRRFDTYRLGLFLGGYTVLYKVCSWVLLRACGRDAAWHALPAGLLAGLALRLYPQRIVALMATTTLLQILMKWICKKKDIKHISVWKYIFISLSTGYLVHCYYIDPDYCPIWFNTTLTSITGGITEELRRELFKWWHQARFPAVVGGI